jgi:peroxiredoxin
MKKPVLVILILSVHFFDGFCQKNLPNIPIQNLKGEQILTPEIFKHKPTIISFWATWCKPCLQEIEAVNDNLADWKKEIDFDFIAISTDDSRSKGRVLPMKNVKKWPFEVFLDENGDLQRAMNVLNIPHTVILNSSGKIIYQHTSYTAGDEEEYLEVLKKKAIKN